MSASRISAFVVLAAFFVAAPATRADDQHSVQAIASALTTPIPEQVSLEAQDADDALLKAGTFDGQKVYLVTDGRSKTLQSLVNRLLVAAGSDPSKWVVRLLETQSATRNAFVFGGRYIYVYTGLVDAATSEDELAFVLGHELGHSLLQHTTRRAADISTTLANLAAIVAALGNESTSDGANAIAHAITSSYSQDDEREADALAVALSRRAGFDPLRGADFFTRNQREQDEASAEQANVKAEQDRLYAAMRENTLALKANCEALKRKWDSSWQYQTPENAAIVNTTCTRFVASADEYNAKINEKNAQDAVAQIAQTQADIADALSSHPSDTDRVASIAAITDYLRGARTLDGLQNYQQGQRVMQALVQTDSAMLKPANQSAPETALVTSVATAGSGSDTQVRLMKLQGLLDTGTITADEYAAKRQRILDDL